MYEIFIPVLHLAACSGEGLEELVEFLPADGHQALRRLVHLVPLEEGVQLPA